VCASWNDAKAFCDWLSGKEGRSYGLPSEAQWEYTCLAGVDGVWWWGDREEDAKGNANVRSSAEYLDWPNPFKGVNDGYIYTAPVGSFKPNPWGVYDIIGNVWEWCKDLFGPYPSGNVSDPKGPSSGPGRVFRGGAWSCSSYLARSTGRSGFPPWFSNVDFGFRVMLPSGTGEGKSEEIRGR